MEPRRGRRSRQRADGLRIFIDGEEVETRILHDDQPSPVTVNGASRDWHVPREAERHAHSPASLQRLRMISGVLEEDQLAAVARRGVAAPGADDARVPGAAGGLASSAA